MVDEGAHHGQGQVILDSHCRGEFGKAVQINQDLSFALRRCLQGPEEVHGYLLICFRCWERLHER